MPFKGFSCPPGGEEPGRRNTIDYCLSQCKQQCVTPPLLAAMWQSEQGNYHAGDYISASMLAGNNCPRQTVWERYEDYWDTPTRKFWPFRGTLAHRLCEDAAPVIDQYGWLQEYKLSVTLQYPDEPAPVFEATVDESGEIGKVFTGKYDRTRCLEITINGTADAYNPFTRQYVDQKSMAEKKAEKTVKGTHDGTYSPNLLDEHVLQFNTYRWLLARTRVPDEIRERFRAYGLPELKGRNFPAPTELVMQGFSMMHLVRSGTPHAWTEGKGQSRTTTMYDVDPVPVLQLTDIEQLIRPKALMWYRYLVLREPTPVVPASRKWLCNNCAFNGERLAHGTCFPERERAAAKTAKVPAGV